MSKRSNVLEEGRNRGDAPQSPMIGGGWRLVMRKRGVISVLLVVGVYIAPTPTSADDVLYRYDCDVLPYDPTAGWLIFNACDQPCTESLEDGHFVLKWADPFTFELVNYHLWIARPPQTPPATLWVEWRYRSDTPFPGTSFTCDGRLATHYEGIDKVLYTLGDTAVSASGADFVTGLDISEFHNYRFESLDGINFRISVDGLVFFEGIDDQPNGVHFLQFGGQGGCEAPLFPTFNEWDFIRYGTISSGEQIVAADPPGGFLDPAIYADLDRFTITFDSANYVYLDDITVEVTGGIAPTVIQTRRLDNGEPQVVEIVLDGPMPLGETTRFTFNDGTVVSVIEYTLIEPPVPTVSQWGIVVMTLLILTAGSMILGRRRGALRDAVS